MDSATLMGVLGGAVVLALVSSIVSLLLHVKSDSVHSLTTRVNQLQLDQQNTFDTVEKWTRRDRVRRLRESREAEPEATQDASPASPKDKKAALRAKLALMRGSVQ